MEDKVKVKNILVLFTDGNGEESKGWFDEIIFESSHLFKFKVDGRIVVIPWDNIRYIKKTKV